MRIERGHIVWLDFGKQGGAIQKNRPALIVQNNQGNKYSPKTIVVAIHGDTKKGLPVSVPVPRGISGLTKDSTIDCGIIATVDKEDLGEIIGVLPSDYMDKVDYALRLSLAL